MASAGRPPIELDKESIICLYDSGLSSQQIGPLFNVSWATINRRLHKWGIPIRFGYPGWNKGLTVLTDERVRKSSEKSSRMTGHKHSDEARAKMSNSQKGNNTWSRGRPLSAEHKERIGEAVKKRWENPEYRAKQIRQLKERWADKDYASRVRALIVKGNHSKPTRPEKQLIDIIERHHLPFRYTGDGSFIICGYSPDFVNCNGEKTVIEVFGDYWHGKGARNWKETEPGRIMTFNSFGYRCIVIWENELNSQTDEVIIRRISDVARRI